MKSSAAINQECGSAMPQRSWTWRSDCCFGVDIKRSEGLRVVREARTVTPLRPKDATEWVAVRQTSLERRTHPGSDP